ncbi:MAG: AMP-binding protein, partial [Acinetobacter sp.]|nr:AMP-binding protein [Acinetobacter sp.]
MKTLNQAYQDFNFDALIGEQLRGSAQAINAYVECCQRHAGQHQAALLWEGKNGESSQWSFEQLDEASGKLA